MNTNNLCNYLRVPVSSNWSMDVLQTALLCAVFAVITVTGSKAIAQSMAPLAQVTQDFASDPHWEGINNRVVGDNCPTIQQDFGWRKKQDGKVPGGEIAGTIWRTRTPAFYAMPVGPFSFDGNLSAEGRIAIAPAERNDGFYIGFFNAARQEWRPWSSLAVRFGEIRLRDPLAIETLVDYMSQTWKAGGYTAGRLPVDGHPHHWRLTYDANATVPTAWQDEKLREYIGDSRKTEPEILSLAQASEPGTTIELIRKRLQAASKSGVIEYQEGRDAGWEVRKDPKSVEGRILLQVDDGPEHAHFIDKAIRNARTTFDRFGVFNFQLPGGSSAFTLSELSVNGKKVDLSHDPGWESHGNRTEFIERDFHAKQDFGFSRTNHAGKAAGEIGGTFWRTEPIDPLHGYYADDIGRLTLDDPISFSGQIAFTAGGTDAGMAFGYFNKISRMAELTDPESGAPLPQTMLLEIEGPTRIGYYLSAQLSPTRTLASHSEGPIFVPTGEKHHFTFDYDPSANNGVGQITMSIDNEAHTLDLTPQQRAAHVTFDRFGLLNIRRGGKYVTVYLDDLRYTARRPADYRPRQYEQTITHVPYPPNGRKY